MLPQYDTDQLIANIKRRCSVPTSQFTFTPADFVALANDELQGEVVPLIMSTREEYLCEPYDVLAPADGVIEIPSTAVGAKLRSVTWRTQQNPLVINNLPKFDLDVIAGVTGAGQFGVNTVAGFYIQGNSIILYPTSAVPVNTNIRLYLYRRTLVLTDSSAYGRVESVDTETNTVVLNFVPTDWTTGSRLNSVSGIPNFKTTNELVTVVTSSSPSVILDSVDGISVGDYLSGEGYSAIPQVPVEAHAYLAQLTAIKCLEGLGDRDGMAAAQKKAELLKDKLLVMISQRVDGSVKKVISPTGGLRLGAGIGRRGRGWGWGL